MTLNDLQNDNVLTMHIKRKLGTQGIKDQQWIQCLTIYWYLIILEVILGHYRSLDQSKTGVIAATVFRALSVQPFSYKLYVGCFCSQNFCSIFIFLNLQIFYNFKTIPLYLGMIQLKMLIIFFVNCNIPCSPKKQRVIFSSYEITIFM